MQQYPMDLREDAAEAVGLTVACEGGGDGRCIAGLAGKLNGETTAHFRECVDRICSAHPGDMLVLNGRDLVLISSEGAEEIRRMAAEGRKFVLDELNQMCYAAMLSAGLTDHVDRHSRIPAVDITGCERVGEGANGIVYRLNDEVLIKVFKRNPDFNTLIRESHLNRLAFTAGVPCPISFGVALVEGRLALMFEMIATTSFAKLAQKDRSNIQRYMDEYVDLVRRLHSIRGDALKPFPKNALMKDLIRKAGRLEELLGSEDTARLREILRSIDEPQVLLHGDIQPCNIRFGDMGASFIDLETLSTGPAIMDLGALRRTLYCDWEYRGVDYNPFLKLSADACAEIWESFAARYYAGADPTVLREKLRMAEIISLVLTLAMTLKRRSADMNYDACAARLRALVEEA